MKFPSRKIRCRNYASYNPKSLNDDLSRADFGPIFQTKSVDKAWMCFRNIFESNFDKHAPYILKQVKGRPCSWLNSEIKAQMND